MKNKKVIKRILIGLAAFIVLFIGALVAIPFLFKDEIIVAVKDAVNENLNAKVDFKDVDISLLRSFPDVSLRINDYSVVGVDDFEGVKLISGEFFGVTLDFWSAWNFGKVPLEIKSIRLEKPDVNVLVYSNGKANYDIAKPTTDTTSTPFQIQLKEYGVYNGNLVYDDRPGGNYVKAVNLTHTGKGDFTQDVYDLQTMTSIDQLTAESGGMAWLKKARFNLDAGINVDMPNMKFTLKENELKINNLVAKFDGWVAMPTDDIDMDLTFSAPQSDFKNLLSIIPNAYMEGYENVKANGIFKLDGLVKGIYSEKPERYPAFKINLDVNNADVKYPDLPLGISGINMKMLVNSPGSNLNQMLVDISQFKLKIGSNPLEGYFKLKTPISDPDIDTKIKGVLDLEELSKAFPMEGVQTLNGIVNADVTAKTKMSTIDKGDYANVNMAGEASIKNMNYVAADLPPVKINSLQMTFTPQNVKVPAFDMNLGKSDMTGSGTLDNILAYFSPDATMKGNFVLRSNYFNADEWMTDEETAPAGGAVATTDEELFNRFDFTLDAAINKMDYDVYKLENLVGKGNFTPSKMTVSQLSGKIGDSDFSASGVLTNVWNYVFYDETLGGKLNLRSNYMNLNQFMTEEPVAANAIPAATEPILVPATINMTMDAQIGAVIYDNMELTNVKGGLIVANEEVKFENMTANSLGGTMAINGGYNTQDHEKPKFDLSMELQQMDFQKAFNTFNTFQAIAPIGKYIEGKFNTKLTMSSFLTKDLMPDLSTLSAAGLLHTLNGAIKGAKPLEDIGNKLNVEALKNFIIKDSKNWFTVKNGAVELQPFDYKFEDIDMRIGGSHQLTGDMNYDMVAKIPRAKIGKNAVGAAANSGLDFLSKEASRVGLNVDAGEFVNVAVKIGGSLLDPKLGFKILGTDGTSTIKDQVAGKIEEEAKKQLDDAKTQAQARLDEEKKKAEEAAEKLAQQAKDEAAKKLEEAAKKTGEEAKEKVGEEVKNKVGEEAKKKLEELNPLKKKKKGGGG